MKKLRFLFMGLGVATCLVAFTRWRGPAVTRDDPAIIALGEKLFRDPRLSVDGSVACATCHVPQWGFTDRRSLARGVRDLEGVRNTPSLLDVERLRSFFWDGRAETLEEQALMPLLNPREMAQPSVEAVEETVRQIPEYVAAFKDSFGDAPAWESIAFAITAYERTLSTHNAPFDRFLAGDKDAISHDAKQGWALFNGKARCVLCHSADTTPPVFTDHGYHNVGIGFDGENFIPLAQRASHLGRMAVTKRSEDLGAFRTTPMRNVGLSAPYMHDGSLATLWDVMDHYNRGGDRNPRLDGDMRKLDLSEEEIVSLVTWMFTLTDDHWQELNALERDKQWAMKDVRPER